MRQIFRYELARKTWRGTGFFKKGNQTWRPEERAPPSNLAFRQLINVYPQSGLLLYRGGF